MKQKYLILLFVCLFGLCISQQVNQKLTEEEIKNSLEQLQNEFDANISTPQLVDAYLSQLQNDADQTEDQKCLNNQYLECKEENRKECISKSFYQYSCTTLRCGFKLNEELPEVYGSCIQRQCISDSEEVQKLSLKTYQCFYAIKYNPVDEQKSLNNYMEDKQEFNKEFDDNFTTMDELHQEMTKDLEKQHAECVSKYFLGCQNDKDCIKQILLQIICVQERCYTRDGQRGPEIYGSCIQNQCKSEFEQIQKIGSEFYQCAYFSKYNQYDDKYVLEKTSTYDKGSNSSLLALSLISISILLL